MGQRTLGTVQVLYTGAFTSHVITDVQVLHFDAYDGEKMDSEIIT